MTFIIFVYLTAISQATEPAKGSSLCPRGGCMNQSAEASEVQAPRSLQTPSPTAKAKPPTVRTTHSREGNLPEYYSDKRTAPSTIERVVYVPPKSKNALVQFTSGTLLHAVIDQRIVASPNVPTPVRATVIDANNSGVVFLGEATLDSDLKRVLITFTKIKDPTQKASITVKASALSESGSIGLEGEFHSNAGAFFVAEVASATATALVDTTVERNQNNLGNYVQAPSIANLGKQGVVSALGKTTEKIAQESKSSPQFTETSPYQRIQILITEDAVQPDA